MRVVQLARSLKMEGREIVKIGKELGIDIANTMSNIDNSDVEKIKAYINKKREDKKNIKPRVDINKIEEKLAKKAKEEDQVKKAKIKEEQKLQEERQKEEEARLAKEKERKEKEEEAIRKEEARIRKEQEERRLKEEEAKKQLKAQEEKLKDEKNNARKKDQTIAKNNKKSKNKKTNKNSKPKRDLRKKTGKQAEKQRAAKRHQKESQVEKNKDQVYQIQTPITVGDLANEIDKSASEIIMKLMSLGVMATINENLDEDVLELLALELDVNIVIPEPEEEKSAVELFNLDVEDDEKDLVERPPVVTVMGHVDHGKTSLLDKIKASKVTEGEAGGITQHIGAYQVESNDRTITFLDTPGHEAFTMMRMRGTQVTDVAILVVAANDGVMPQTIEAISHAQAAEVPLIIAINKIDLPEANIEKTKSDLAEHNLVSEEWGGDTIMVPVSAKTGEGIDELLEMVLLVADIQELKANPARNAVATIIDAKLDTGRGPVATVLVENGTLRTGDYVASGVASGRIRKMINDKGETVRQAGPSSPVEIQGLSVVPNAGDYLYSFEDEKTSRDYAEHMDQELRKERLAESSKISLDDLFERIQEGELKDLNLIIKGDVKGSIEALSASLLKLSTDEVKINIIHSAVGGIAESDVTLASTSNAIIIGFNVRPNNNALDLAQEEDIEIYTYTVIYQAIEDIENAVKGMHAPKYVENFIGRVEVRDTFKLPNGTIVAGGYVQSGKITRDSKLTILRDNIILHEGELASLKRFQDDVSEVAQGYECGLGIDNFNDIQIGDIIEASVMEEVVD